MNRVVVGLMVGGTETWTRDGDRLYDVDVHPSGCLLIHVLDDDGLPVLRAVRGLGTWLTVDVDPPE